jgi:hypothetical protein
MTGPNQQFSLGEPSREPFFMANRTKMFICDLGE